MKQPIAKQATPYSYGSPVVSGSVVNASTRYAIPSTYGARTVATSVEGQRALLHGTRYTVQSTQGHHFTACIYDAPTWRFLLGRSGKALTLDAIAAVWDGRAFVEIGAWCAEPVCGGLAA